MMRAVLLAVAFLAPALPAAAQTTDFTVKPSSVENPPRFRIDPQITPGGREFFEPAGSRDGPKALDLRVSRFADRGRTEFSVKLFSEIGSETEGTAPYRAVLSPKKERIITFGWRRSFW